MRESQWLLQVVLSGLGGKTAGTKEHFGCSKSACVITTFFMAAQKETIEQVRKQYFQNSC